MGTAFRFSCSMAAISSRILARLSSPLGAIILPVNAHDSTLPASVIVAVVVEWPFHKTIPQHLSLDKGFDTPDARAAVAKAKYTTPIRSIGEKGKS